MIKEETSTKGYQKDTQGRAHVGRLRSEYEFYSFGKRNPVKDFKQRLL